MKQEVITSKEETNNEQTEPQIEKDFDGKVIIQIENSKNDTNQPLIVEDTTNQVIKVNGHLEPQEPLKNEEMKVNLPLENIEQPKPEETKNLQENQQIIETNLTQDKITVEKENVLIENKNPEENQQNIETNLTQEDKITVENPLPKLEPFPTQKPKKSLNLDDLFGSKIEDINPKIDSNPQSFPEINIVKSENSNQGFTGMDSFFGSEENIEKKKEYGNDSFFSTFDENTKNTETQKEKDNFSSIGFENSFFEKEDLKKEEIPIEPKEKLEIEKLDEKNDDFGDGFDVHFENLKKVNKDEKDLKTIIEKEIVFEENFDMNLNEAIPKEIKKELSNNEEKKDIQFDENFGNDDFNTNFKKEEISNTNESKIEKKEPFNVEIEPPKEEKQIETNPIDKDDGFGEGFDVNFGDDTFKEEKIEEKKEMNIEKKEDIFGKSEFDDIDFDSHFKTEEIKEEKKEIKLESNTQIENKETLKENPEIITEIVKTEFEEKIEKTKEQITPIEEKKEIINIDIKELEDLPPLEDKEPKKKLTFSISPEKDLLESPTNIGSVFLQTPAPTDFDEDFNEFTSKTDFGDDFETFEKKQETKDDDLDFGEFESSNSTEQDPNFGSYVPKSQVNNSTVPTDIYEMMMNSSNDMLQSIATTVMTKILPPLFTQAEDKAKSQNSLEKLFNSNLKNSVFEKMGTWKGSMIETLLIKSVSISKEPKLQQVKRHTRNISIYEQIDGPKLDTIRASRDELRIEKIPRKFSEVEKKEEKSFEGFDDNFDANFEKETFEPPKITEPPKIIEPTKPEYINEKLTELPKKIENPKIIEPQIKQEKLEMNQKIETKIETIQKKENFDGFDDFDPDFSNAEFTTDFDHKPIQNSAKNEVKIETKMEQNIAPIEYNSQQTDVLLSFLGSKFTSKTNTVKNDSPFGDLFNGISTPNKQETPEINDLDFILNKLKKNNPKSDTKSDPKIDKKSDTKIEKKNFEGFDENSHFETKTVEEVKIDDPKVENFLSRLPDLSFLNSNFSINKKEFFEGFE